jgi:hypothetical protein
MLQVMTSSSRESNRSEAPAAMIFIFDPKKKLNIHIQINQTLKQILPL